MININIKKVEIQAISTIIALGSIIQIQSAQAAILTVNNVNDSGIGSLRDIINIANNDDVIEFLLGSNASTITLTSGELEINKNLTINGASANLLTIKSNNEFPVFNISNSADVKLSGLTISSSINLIGGSQVKLADSIVRGDYVKINLQDNSNLTLINSIINAGSVEITAQDTSTITVSNSTNSGNTGEVTGGNNNSGGNITITPGGNIIIISGPIQLKPIPEANMIVGSIIASGLAWLMKRKKALFYGVKKKQEHF
ncbi:hypothetical protein [Nostoc parmelioides]|uniref:Uncharacterized protein n=1 Tax=Nostoc parmelioides FACHB-3921 TaxID=2692909 RepID=A0ABR8BP06_9NOSO|nr:hypothetical protein [Nostoc parmelioides]MBD2255693.1 hypothetical protein [Nostoc parmelioides FACHB-3921]